MRTRDRDPRQETRPPEPAPAPAGDDATRRARSLLDLGDDLIRRALSGDSKAFLAQNRQHGGE